MDLSKKPILGMIHLSGPQDQVLERAKKEILIYQEEGVDGIILENYHSGMFHLESICIEAMGMRARGEINMLVGVNALPNNFEMAMKYAYGYYHNFVQVDYIAGLYDNHSQIDPEALAEYREKYPVKVLGGVWPKYYTPVAGSNLEVDLNEGVERTDAVVVTGSATGKETPLDKIKQFRDICGNHPLIIGAGLDASNVAEQLPFSDGAIVGSCFKPYKRTTELVSRTLVKEFMDEVKKVR